MTAKNTKADIEARAAQLIFPASDDWKNIVHDLKLTKIQERELEITFDKSSRLYTAIGHDLNATDLLQH